MSFSRPGSDGVAMLRAVRFANRSKRQIMSMRIERRWGGGEAGVGVHGQCHVSNFNCQMLMQSLLVVYWLRNNNAMEWGKEW